jgi:hypothetical protein
MPGVKCGAQQVRCAIRRRESPPTVLAAGERRQILMKIFFRCIQ